MTDVTPLVRVKNLSVSYNGTPAIEGIDFDVYSGETLAIVGPNGAGKTTIFRALLGLTSYKGKVMWKKGVRIGYVPQRMRIEKDTPLSVKEFFDLKGGGKVETALGAVGLNASVLTKALGILSSGELQRVLIAWALTGDSDILLFDEPTEGIDVGGEETIYNILHNLRENKKLAVIVISHDISMVYKHAVKVLCLNRQKICYGSPAEVMNVESLRALYGKEVTVYPHTHA